MNGEIDMTREELKKHPDYIDAYNKVKNYPKGFKFTIKYNEIPTAKANALKILLRECCDEKLLESISIGVTLTGERADETFVRL